MAFLRRIEEREGCDLSEIFPDASELAIDLLAKLLVFNPAQRLSVADALQHPWFAALHTHPSP